MKRIIIGAAALAAVAIPTTVLAAGSREDGPSLLESIAIDRLAIGLFAPELCDAARDLSTIMSNDEVVDEALAIFIDAYGPHDPAVYVYVAGLITGCVN